MSTPTPTVQIHLTGAKARVAIAANTAAAQAAVAAGKPVPAPKPIPWSGFSGRGVRLHTIDAEEKDLAAACAAREVGVDATAGEYTRRRLRECVNRCIVEVTRERELTDLAGAAWMRLTQQDLDGAGAGKHSAATLFTAKDVDVLNGWFQSEHDASQADLEAVMGGAIEVVSDG